MFTRKYLVIHNVCYFIDFSVALFFTWCVIHKYHFSISNILYILALYFLCATHFSIGFRVHTWRAVTGATVRRRLNFLQSTTVGVTLTKGSGSTCNVSNSCLWRWLHGASVRWEMHCPTDVSGWVNIHLACEERSQETIIYIAVRLRKWCYLLNQKGDWSV